MVCSIVHIMGYVCTQYVVVMYVRKYVVMYVHKYVVVMYVCKYVVI